MPTAGDLLRERRQERQWTLAEVAQQTRIREDFLKALEEGSYALLPSETQVRGFLRSYAETLGLNADEVIALYQQEQGDPELVSIAPLTPPPRARSCLMPSLSFVLFTFLALLAVGLIIDRGWLNPTTLPPTATPPGFTPTRILPTATPTATPTLQVFITPPRSTASPRSTRSQPGEGIEAVLEIAEPCWLRVEADGVEIFEGTLANTSRTFTATEALSIRMGNAGSVRVILNGEDLGLQGNPGQVVTQSWEAGQ
ncbi:MAG: helix-turn-helix domain-containing protein [Chloroflexia bacterium]|nr:helix-turn-helix domain-containing protein [Chloroflexia bacterium]